MVAPSNAPAKREAGWDDTGGPLSNLSVLWDDNRQSVLEIMRQSPNGKEMADEGEPVPWKQRLVFADSSLQSLILRNVLRDPLADGVAATAAAIARHRKQKQPLKQLSQAGGLPIPPKLGIVGVQVLEDRSISDKGAVETYESVFAVEDIADEAQVVVYFCRPTPVHAQLVAKKIKALEAARASGTTAVSSSSSDNNKFYHRIVFLPYCTSMCQRILLDEGVLAMDAVSIRELHLDLVPLDNDVLSMELSDVLKECYVDGIPSFSVASVARAMAKLQDLCGTIPHLQSLGPLGEAVLSQMCSLRLDEYTEENLLASSGGDNGQGNTSLPASVADVATVVGEGSDSHNPHEIQALLVIDRKVDLVTPLLTPLTYEGLIDEVVGIDSGYIQVEESLIDPNSGEEDEKEKEKQSTNPFDSNDNALSVLSSSKPRKVAVALNGTDTLFAEVRSQHVEKFGSFLQDQAKALKERHSNFTTKKDADLTQIHEFVKSIPVFTQNLRSLTLQIHLAEMVKAATQKVAFQEQWHTERSMLEGETCYEILEELTSDDTVSVYNYLRLLCLQSLTSGGIRANKFDSLRKDVVQTYGYEYLFTLGKLEKLGALKKRESSYFDSGSPFSTLRKLLSLINAEVNNVSPDDVSYVSSGYAPLSVRLVQQTCSASGWRGKEDILKELPGRMIHVLQRSPPEDFSQATSHKPRPQTLTKANASGSSLFQKSSPAKPVLLVFYIGGVSLMEIASLRLLSKLPSFPFRIIIGTTKIVNGKSLLKSLE